VRCSSEFGKHSERPTVMVCEKTYGIRGSAGSAGGKRPPCALGATGGEDRRNGLHERAVQAS
jgi:hypothetical protein